MEPEDIREFESETTQGTLKVRVMDLENGLLVLMSDSERFRFGLSAVGIPPSKGRSEPTSTGLFATGFDLTLVRTLAERIAAWTNRTCMIVVAVQEMNRTTMMEIIGVLRKHLLT